MKKALIIVDVQNDFCEGGSLAVTDANSIISVINSLTKNPKYDLIIATQDFHPQNHSSFVSNNPNGVWPDHCVQGTKGTEMHPDLDLSNVVKVFPKGTNPDVDSYSGFFDNDKKSSTGMGEWLKSFDVTHVDVVGLALDYCVKATALDAKQLGFDVCVLLDATKAVNIKPDDGANAIVELSANDVKLSHQSVIREESILPFKVLSSQDLIGQVNKVTYELNKRGVHQVYLEIVHEDDAESKIVAYGDRFATQQELDKFNQREKDRKDRDNEWRKRKMESTLENYTKLLTKEVQKKNDHIAFLENEQKKHPERGYYKKAEKVKARLQIETDSLTEALTFKETLEKRAKFFMPDWNKYKTLTIWAVARNLIKSDDVVSFK